MTRAEAIKQALQNLKVLDAVSNPAAEDAATAGERLDQVRAELSERGLVWWSEDDIPLAVSGAFCALVAAECGPAFNKQYDASGAIGRIGALKSSAERPVTKALYY